MALKLAAPLIESVKLEDIDPTGETFAVFAQATMEQHERRNQVFADREYSWSDNELGVVRQKSKWNPDEQARLEVFLTMRDCNILGPDDQPLFPYREGKIGEAQFNRAWAKLPPEWAASLHAACYRVNKVWAGRPKAAEAS